VNAPRGMPRPVNTAACAAWRRHSTRSAAASRSCASERAATYALTASNRISRAWRSWPARGKAREKCLESATSGRNRQTRAVLKPPTLPIDQFRKQDHYYNQARPAKVACHPRHSATAASEPSPLAQPRWP
jgi:hypothetical protein